MRRRVRLGALALSAGASLVLASLLPAPIGNAAKAQAATVRALNVNLANTTGPVTHAGEGILYGMSTDGQQPGDNILAPLKLNAFRGGGSISGGWIKDGYKFGPATQADISTIIAEAKRLEAAPYQGLQYQVMLSAVYGARGGVPGTIYPCDSNDCSNWQNFLGAVIGELNNSGLTFAYDIWNEPDQAGFWGAGLNSVQYFQMWDSGYRAIRRLAPTAKIIGPSFARTPIIAPTEWTTWLNHVKSASTAPDLISNHEEADSDDPVADAQAVDKALTAAGLPQIPLTANEYQPKDKQNAGETAWFLARLAQSDYHNAMRGNWINCCTKPDGTGILTLTTSNGWVTNGNWWAMRYYADFAGSIASTSGLVSSTAIAASEDSNLHQAEALVGDSAGYTGPASVTFNGLSSVTGLVQSGTVHVTVYRIPDQAELTARVVVLNQTKSVANNSITVPFSFAGTHDAFAIYLS